MRLLERLARSAPASALDRMLFPRTCLLCGAPLEDRGTATDDEVCCPLCTHRLLSSAGRPPGGVSPDMRQALDYWRPLVGAYSCLNYYREGGAARTLVHAFKYHGNRSAAVCMGRLMGRVALSLGVAQRVQIVTGVPLAPARQRARGYNQSDLLALGFAQATGARAITGIVERSKFDGSQTHLGHMARLANVSASFRPGPNAPLAQGRTLMILDDVYTTGATLGACLFALKDVDTQVAVATLARACY